LKTSQAQSILSPSHRQIHYTRAAELGQTSLSPFSLTHSTVEPLIRFGGLLCCRFVIYSPCLLLTSTAGRKTAREEKRAKKEQKKGIVVVARRTPPTNTTTTNHPGTSRLSLTATFALSQPALHEAAPSHLDPIDAGLVWLWSHFRITAAVWCPRYSPLPQ
jgi:hypothetical protein